MKHGLSSASWRVADLISTNMRLTLVINIAFSFFAGLANAAAWETVGPPGGFATSVVADPSDPARVYVRMQTPFAPSVFYRSNNSGASWARMPTPANCNPPASYNGKATLIFPREDGQLFIRCAQGIWRSRNAGVTWELFGPPGIDGWLAFEPGRPNRAAIRYGSLVNVAAGVLLTDNDGATWTTITPGTPGAVPQLIAWDPATPGRLLGAYSDYTKYNGGEPAWLFESRDGDFWRPVAKVAEASMYEPSCLVRDFVADIAGQLLVNNDCNLARSNDRGQTWRAVSGFRLSQDDPVVADPQIAGRFVALKRTEGLVQSRDAGESWQTLPSPPGGAGPSVALTSANLWTGATKGVYRADTGGNSWILLNEGIYEQFVTNVAVGAGPPVSLAVVTSPTANAVSIDGGAHWADLQLHATEFATSVGAPEWMYAVDLAGALHRSANGGTSWQLVNAKPAIAPFYQISNIRPVGPQPGRIYAIGRAFETGSPSFPPPLVGIGVLRSDDGGIAWSQVGTVLPSSVEHLGVSPVDWNAIMVSSRDGVYAASDAGTAGTWRRVRNASAIPTPDAASAKRWYLHGDATPLIVTDDFGATWRGLNDPLMLSPTWALVIEATNPLTLTTVGSKGDVTRSRDGGISWRQLIAPVPDLEIVTTSVSPFASNTIYAPGSRGVLRLANANEGSLGTQIAVEYFRSDLNHYFLTANPLEIVGLDTGSPVWKRTGLSFNVLAASTRLDEGAAPVCRFYGRPEKGLDSHFFSVAVEECEAVIQRFSDSWQFETSSAFSAFRPTQSGECPLGTVPIYRVYNGKPDANHRYITSIAVRNDMQAKGWIAEGYGPNAVAMCGPL